MNESVNCDGMGEVYQDAPEPNTVKFAEPFKEARPVTFDEILDAVNKLTEQLTNIAGSLDQLAHNSDMKRLYG